MFDHLTLRRSDAEMLFNKTRLAHSKGWRLRMEHLWLQMNMIPSEKYLGGNALCRVSQAQQTQTIFVEKNTTNLRVSRCRPLLSCIYYHQGGWGRPKVYNHYHQVAALNNKTCSYYRQAVSQHVLSWCVEMLNLCDFWTHSSLNTS